MSRDVFTDAAGKVNITGVQTDAFGNPLGNEYDLAKDGAFKGYTVAVLHLYTGEGFDFVRVNEALHEKGFDIIRWADHPPKIKEFKEKLWQCCQLWIISNAKPLLHDDLVEEIDKYFKAGHGVYIWGDNDPYYVDANVVGERLLNATMKGNVPGDTTVAPQTKSGGPGFKQHLIMTGLNYLYEGVTIATIKPSTDMDPIVFGSAGNLVTAAYDRGGCRALFDGGFTRLFFKWDTAGTGRYVKNAAAWLANVDQWGRQEHVAPVRHLAGQVDAGKATPKVFFYNAANQGLQIGGYWEEEAKGMITLFDASQSMVKEERFSGKEHYFDVENAGPGIWSATISFTRGKRKKYSYVLSIAARE